MTQLRQRVQRLEATATPTQHTGCVRIIQNGELTPDQERQIAEAEAQGKMVIVRQIVCPESR